MKKKNQFLAMLEKNYVRTVLMLIGFHLAVAIIMQAIASSSILSHLHNGKGLWNFSGDSFAYHEQAVWVLGFLQDGDWFSWWNAEPLWPHVKWIALTYWLLWVNPLAFELFNAPAWVLTVVSIWLSGRFLYVQSPRLAYVPALLFGFLPSYILSTTQLLRDPIYILGICLMILGWVLLFKRKKAGWGTGTLAMGFVMTISMKGYLEKVIVPVLIIGLIVMAISRKDVRYAAFTAIAAISMISMFYSPVTIETVDLSINKSSVLVINKAQNPDTIKTQNPDTIKTQNPDTIKTQNLDTMNGKSSFIVKRVDIIANKIAANIVRAREGFRNSAIDAGSRIDGDVQLKSFSDIVSYSVRAVQIGFLAPFPNTWGQPGKQTGRVGKIIVAGETLLFYLLLMASFYCLLVQRELSIVLSTILLVSVIIIVLLGFVVNNVGAIYRMRIGYFIPFYLTGVYGLYLLRSRYNSWRN